ncbi:cytochrome P450 [Ramaria rubella]|nr:cytochrome P450 [Ramaria rubella]
MSLDWLIFVVVTASLVIIWRRRRGMSPFPAGPPGYPIIGASLSVPKLEPWKTYADWAHNYGTHGVMSFTIFGKRVFFLNSAQAAADTLEKDAAVFSDRPTPVMATTMMGRHDSIFYIAYGDRFRRYRKLLHTAMSPSASKRYWSIQEREAQFLLQNLMHNTGDLYRHVRKCAVAVIMETAFGYRVSDPDDQFVQLAEKAVIFAARMFDNWLVESIPILRFLPSWFPGAGFKRFAGEWKAHLHIQAQTAIDYANGTAIPSYTSLHLTPPVTTQQEEDLYWTASALYIAATDTSASVVYTFIYLMGLYPQIQKKAQSEVDAVVGPDRLPTMHDRPYLPYLDAIMRETMRWGPPAPMGISRKSSEDRVYQGLSIPKGSEIIMNIWGMLHDPIVYPEPDLFNPQRFDTSDGKASQADPFNIVFGFGRRICPGMYTAQYSVFIQMASILATLDIGPPVNASGVPMGPDPAWTTTTVSYLQPFHCTFTPRSEKAIQLINSQQEG